MGRATAWCMDMPATCKAGRSSAEEQAGCLEGLGQEHYLETRYACDWWRWHRTVPSGDDGASISLSEDPQWQS